jgi:DNA-binding response OmpR family regulator
MIYIVDEDVIQLRPYAIELEIRGYNVKQLNNADCAYRILSQAKDIEFVLLDIMLATEDSNTSRYKREETRDFIKTGLLLLEDLNLANPEYFPSHVAVFSMGSQEWLVKEIIKSTINNNIPYLRKREFPSPYLFGDKIEELLGENGE